jgi:ABC-2 type transport system permease protein
MSTMFTTFRLLFKGALRDRISLGYGIAFPIVIIAGLGTVFAAPAYRHLLLTGMLAVSVLFFSLQGIAFESLAQRNSGVYKLLRATPYHTFAFIWNLAAGRGALTLISSLLVLVFGALLYGFALSWLMIILLLPVLILGILCFSLLGLVASNLAQNESQVAIMTNTILGLPMLFTSEVFFSLASAPSWVRLIGKLLPLSHLIDGIRAAFTGNPDSMLMPLLILSGYTLLALLLAVLTFRWDSQAVLFGGRTKLA